MCVVKGCRCNRTKSLETHNYFYVKVYMLIKVYYWPILARNNLRSSVTSVEGIESFSVIANTLLDIPIHFELCDFLVLSHWGCFFLSLRVLIWLLTLSYCLLWFLIIVFIIFASLHVSFLTKNFKDQVATTLSFRNIHLLLSFFLSFIRMTSVDSFCMRSKFANTIDSSHK